MGYPEIIVTNAFKKKQQKLPENQKEKAINYMNDYIKRNQEGAYYEEN
ncbi:MAG: addiction module toxin RelE [Dolichospermum sp. DET50]|nr:addiction module toxin RelE [Dolichospermum sp. DET66]MBS3034673.1 addiction module toxin RelE [Dolichospermum sp. DET67]MBS3039876.1 addiction module toxin RelE [Dolichospermum sp. DET50]